MFGERGLRTLDSATECCCESSNPVLQVSLSSSTRLVTKPQYHPLDSVPRNSSQQMYQLWYHRWLLLLCAHTWMLLMQPGV